MDRIQKWRLILGKQADPEVSDELQGAASGMDGVLEALYDSDRKGGLGRSAPNVNRWLGDIRRYFPASIVQVMQRDALDRLQLQQILTEPALLEMVEPDVNLVATLLSLNKVLPAKTRETARMVVRKVVEDLEKRLKNPLQEAIRGALNRAVRNYRPRYQEIDWRKTVRANLKHYQADLKVIIPERLIGFRKKGHALREVILLVDQSGSMAGSVVYAGVLGAVMASLRSVRTHFVAFDTSVVDLTAELDDPVDLLFGVQLGGGTDINRALGYALNLIRNPSETIPVLISDLFEGGNQSQMLKKVAEIKASGAQVIVLLALSDEGILPYDRQVAGLLASMDIPCFACTPDHFPEVMAAAVRKDLHRGWRPGVG